MGYDGTVSYNGPEITLENILAILSSSPDSAIALLLALLNIVIIIRYLRRFGFYYKGRYNFTLVSILLGLYGVVMVVPSPIFFADSQSPSRYAYLISVQACPVLMIAGASLASAVMGRQARVRLDHFFCGPIRGITTGNSAALKMMYGIFLAVSIVTFIAMLLTMPYVPLIGAMTNYGDVAGLDVRLSVYTMPMALQWLYALNVRLLLPFCVLYTYIMKRAGHSAGTAFYLTLTWTMACALLTFERQMPLGTFGLLFLASAVIGGRSKMLQKGLVLLGGITAGGIVSLLQYNKALVDVTESVRTFLVGRVWINPAWFASVMFERFGDGPFLLGKTIRLVGLFSDEYRNITSIGFLTDMWVNFGWIGVLCGPVVVGFVLQWIQLRYFRTRTVSNLIIYTIFTINGMWLVYSNMLLTMAVSVFGIGIAYLALTETFTQNMIPTMRHDRRIPPAGSTVISRFPAGA